MDTIYLIVYSNYDPLELPWVFKSKELRDRKLDELYADGQHEWNPVDIAFDDEKYLEELVLKRVSHLENKDKKGE